MTTLTKRQKQIYDFVGSYIKKRDLSPTLEEIKKHFRLSSLSTVHQHIETLASKGFLAKHDNQARGISLKGKASDLVKIPLLGTIAAGEPIEAIQQGESIAVPKSKIPAHGEVYALRVVGNSMIDENINDGDVILVKQQSVAENGQKIVALIDNYEATLKKFYRERGQIRLQPANKSMEPLIFRNGKDVSIQGIVLDVIKNIETPVKETQAPVKTTTPTLQKEKVGARILVNNLNDLSATEWIPETVSVFVQKGLGSNHADTNIEKQHPAPFSFQDVGRLIRFFTKKNQLVLDPFCGVGSTLKACAVNNRRGVGIEIVRKYVDLTKDRLKTELRDDLFGSINRDQKIVYGDALEEIKKLDDNSFDFIVTSPPYWNILAKADHKVKQERISKNLDTKYSDLKKDLGNIANYDKFLDILSGFFNDCGRILRPKKYLAIIVSDFRHKDRFYTFHTDLSSRLQKGNFALKGITVLYQKFKKIFPYGYPYSYVPNIHHQYILILQNRKEYVNKK